MTSAPAIRATGLGMFFGPPLEMDGAERPREAWRSLMLIAGIKLRPAADGPPGLSVAGPGKVLDDLNFEIARGSAVCLIGPSGSGKSVLLKILAGITPPTSGRVEIRGRVASLLTSGGSVDGKKTAIDNVRATEAYKALPPEAAERLVEEVIAFAEIEGFERAPMRTFSTGMTLRLAAALALCGTPDIVLIDDVLAVGDIGFQQRLVERIRALKEAGVTLVIASQDEKFVQQIASRVLTLSEGRIVHDSAEQDSLMGARPDADAELEWQRAQALPDDEVLRFTAIDGRAVAAADETYFDLRMEVVGRQDAMQCRPVVSVLNEDGVTLFRSLYPEFAPLGQVAVEFTVRLPTRMLPRGRYGIALGIISMREGQAFATKSHNAVRLTVHRDSEPEPEPEIVGKRERVPLLQPVLDWEVDDIEASQAVTVP